MSAVVDHVALKELLDIMGDVYPTLVATFESDSKLRIQQLHEAIAQHDGASLKNVAHTFKGSAGNLCALELVELLKQVEACGGRADYQTAQTLIVRVEHLFSDLITCLKCEIVE